MFLRKISNMNQKKAKVLRKIFIIENKIFDTKKWRRFKKFVIKKKYDKR